MIEVRHLRMEYGDTVALENLHLEIPAGEVYGLIGPNGAGKTTLIRILSTLLEPTFGYATIAGVDILREPLRVHRLISYMPDSCGVYEAMTSWEYLDHFARCYKIEAGRREKLIDDVLDLVSLDVRRDSPTKTLSRGMRQRLCFAKALLHEPQVMLLDEPASGLDPAGRMELRELIKRLRQMGRTILVSSHILSEMAEFCTSIGILEEGRLVVSGRVEDILRRLQPEMHLQLTVLEDPARLVRLLQERPEAADVTWVEGTVECRWRGARDTIPQLHQQLVTRGIPLVTLAIKEHSLEDIYMKLSGHRTS